jgi:predicted Rossmann fold nucleotide-binding protein DprA/Smf involved in DNA uptake
MLAFELERLQSRGIWMVARSDEEYPARLKGRLGLRAPAVLFGAGRREMMPGRGVAVVGSRDASEAALQFADDLGRALAADGTTVVSGAARGVDRTAMNGAIDAGGGAVGVVADSLARLTQQPDIRSALAEEELTLVTPYAPEARFSVGNAMGRNRLIYCLADAAVVVATSAGSGGTWGGAVENMKAGWVPLWVWSGDEAPSGNRELLSRGGLKLERIVSVDSLVTGGDDANVAPDSRADDLLGTIESFLATPRTEREVCDELGLDQGTARRLLKRGVESGRLTREGKPFQYLAASVPEQATLFDAA